MARMRHMNPATSPTERVLVVGATGALGRPTVQLLRERAVAVRALNRHPEQAADLAALGAEVVGGDLTDPASLVRACAGVTRVLAAAICACAERQRSTIARCSASGGSGMICRSNSSGGIRVLDEPPCDSPSNNERNVRLFKTSARYSGTALASRIQ